mmetsp:Transcript_19505/g.34797  ORF Transcript_19505/g.34797 Transcript_19505/m.34797 type:complete len:236 (-) Transcript_19505:91-798(-)
MVRLKEAQKKMRPRGSIFCQSAAGSPANVTSSMLSTGSLGNDPRFHHRFRLRRFNTRASSFANVVANLSASPNSPPVGRARFASSLGFPSPPPPLPLASAFASSSSRFLAPSSGAEPFPLLLPVAPRCTLDLTTNPGRGKCSAVRRCRDDDDDDDRTVARLRALSSEEPPIARSDTAGAIALLHKSPQASLCPVHLLNLRDVVSALNQEIRWVLWWKGRSNGMTPTGRAVMRGMT